MRRPDSVFMLSVFRKPAVDTVGKHRWIMDEKEVGWIYDMKFLEHTLYNPSKLINSQSCFPTQVLYQA